MSDVKQLYILSVVRVITANLSVLAGAFCIMLDRKISLFALAGLLFCLSEVLRFRCRKLAARNPNATDGNQKLKALQRFEQNHQQSVYMLLLWGSILISLLRDNIRN